MSVYKALSIKVQASKYLAFIVILQYTIVFTCYRPKMYAAVGSELRSLRRDT
jgi:hypothetical protein